MYTWLPTVTGLRDHAAKMTYHSVTPYSDNDHKSLDQYAQDKRISSSHQSRLPPSSIRIQCKVEGKYLTINIFCHPSKSNSLIQPIKFTLPDQLKSINNNTNLGIKVSTDSSAYRFLESNSLYINNKKAQENGDINGREYKSPSITFPYSSQSRSQLVLHRRIEDLCKNGGLMDDGIVFFLKNDEFYVRI
ncbi:unnamed protein product [Didymodactylos carnosus]|uniref:Uncharacterized protein n=1 Tax=Didymodactylos carnosus TaxID=1234261 RepID=A0A814J1R9_9BILA|nr:unnamed protein product [Didymodactylos carnosus]CAF1148492.1 unnamed protein product [Didymodactylos carnosus]CAF3802920.1 unnamed protein product [Didymodactylos carnosus]CAF3952402.1 unnamed protein product [Didymodactylos carnosus]